MVRKKVDARVRSLIENGVKTNHRSSFVLVGDHGKDQVWTTRRPLRRSPICPMPACMGGQEGVVPAGVGVVLLSMFGAGCPLSPPRALILDRRCRACRLDQPCVSCNQRRSCLSDALCVGARVCMGSCPLLRAGGARAWVCPDETIRQQQSSSRGVNRLQQLTAVNQGRRLTHSRFPSGKEAYLQ